MRFDKFTMKSQELIQQAQTLATQHHNTQIEPEHLLAAMLGDSQGIAGSILRKLGVSAGGLAGDAARLIEQLPKISQPAEVYLSTRTKNILNAAFKEAAAMKDEYVSVEHILLAICDEKKSAGARLLHQHGVTRDAVFLCRSADICAVIVP